jgi:cysteine desulfurase family protein
LAAEVTQNRRIYLDNAATSFPKPDEVYRAVDIYQRTNGAAIGRGAYSPSIEVTSAVQRCRTKLARLWNVPSPNSIVFTFNGTDSLNLAIQGILRPGDHVVTSVIEHNSVLRPLRALQDRLGIEITHVGADPAGRVDPAQFRQALRPQTRLVALVHASNVTGGVQPIVDVGEIARNHGAVFLVDGAQSAGHAPLDLASLPVDLFACPGHKGLLGPLGTGVLYIRPGIETELQSHRQGGTGTVSEDDRQPESLPEKYESGNHNAPGLVGLEAGVSWILERGVATLAAEEKRLTARLWEGLSAITGIRLLGPPPGEERVGVVSLTIDGFEPQDAAAILDENFGIQVRAGLHCAPGVHRALGTFAAGGTIRMSVGPFSTAEDVDAAIGALGELAGSSFG